MNVSEMAEEVLEALWMEHETNPNEAVKLSRLRTMPDMHTLKELLDNHVLEKHVGDEIRLTEKGITHARYAVRRHRLAERLLTDILAVKSSLIHDAACKFEHHLHKGIDENVCTLLGHPKFCPHGRTIPEGRCCREAIKVVSPAVSPLSSLKPGNKGHVAYLHTTDPKRAQMLISMGVIPGASICLLASFPSLLFQLGEGQFAVDAELARAIYIRLG